MAGIVELFLTDGEPVYINPARITRMIGRAGSGPEATVIYFEGETNVVVNGDLDGVAFKLFPDSAR